MNCLPSSVRAALRRARFSASGAWFGSLVSGSTAVNNRRRRDKAGDVVHVAVRIVAGDAAIEPEHLVDAEIIVKSLLQLLAADAGIALLHFAEQALLGGEQNPLRRWCRWSRLPAPAYAQCRPPASTAGCHSGRPSSSATRPGTWSSSRQLSYLAQRIEAPVGHGDFALGIAHENRPGVARPTAIRGPQMKAHAVEICARALQNAVARRSAFASVDQNVHALARRKQAHDLRIDPGNG